MTGGDKLICFFFLTEVKTDGDYYCTENRRRKRERHTHVQTNRQRQKLRQKTAREKQNESANVEMLNRKKKITEGKTEGVREEWKGKGKEVKKMTHQ